MVLFTKWEFIHEITHLLQIMTVAFMDKWVDKEIGKMDVVAIIIVCTLNKNQRNRIIKIK
jgi:hypothetical protein